MNENGGRPSSSTPSRHSRGYSRSSSHRPASGNHVDMPRFKICLSGKAGVGKTSIFLRLQGENFYRDKKPALGIDNWSYIVSKNSPKSSQADVHVDDSSETVEYAVHDTAGMETHASLTLGNHYRGTHCLLLVYDIGDKDSLFYLDHEFKAIEKQGYAPDAKFILVANKSDLQKSKIDVTEDFESSFLENRPHLLNNIYKRTKTSAAFNTGITELFYNDIPGILTNAKPVNRVSNVFQSYENQNMSSSKEKDRNGCC